MRKTQAPRLVIAAPASGSGKTLLACGLLAALRQKKIQAAAFKCGPDYIDPMFHEAVLGIPSKNLDTFLAGRGRMRQLFLADAVRADVSVIEGVMGLYDGLGGVTKDASTWDVAAALEAPVILVVDAGKASVSVLALIRGFLAYAQQEGGSRIRGVVFNRLSPGRYPALKALAEEELGVRVCGFLPRLDDVCMESRHLGLVMPGEIPGLRGQMERLGQQCLETLDIPLLLSIAGEAPALQEEPLPAFPRGRGVRPVIAVARDEAFSFYYKDNLRLLEMLGAQLHPFSPLRDRQVPAEADALLLGGGYPELYGRELSENRPMRDSVQGAVAGGMPCLAECGGFLYLQEELEDRDGRAFEMAGALKGRSRYTGKLSRFGYVTLTAPQAGETALLMPGESLRGHEFHYMDTDGNGTDLLAVRPVTGRSWPCGHMTDRFYGGFPHLYLWSHVETAARFVRKAEEYGRERHTR